MCALLTQPATLDHLQRQTALDVRRAFRRAHDKALPPLRRFIEAYRRERQDTEDDDDPSNLLLWLTLNGHTETVRAILSGTIHDASEVSLAATLQGQDAALHAGVQAGQQSVMALFTAVPATPFTAVPVPPWRGGRSGYDGAPIMAYFDRLPPEAWAIAQKRLYAGVGTGMNGAQLLASLLLIFGSVAAHALLIAETELTNAFRDMMRRVFAANAQTVQGWYWRALPDACAFCQSMDGTWHTVDESLDSHPRCRCEMKAAAHPPRE